MRTRRRRRRRNGRKHGTPRLPHTSCWTRAMVKANAPGRRSRARRPSLGCPPCSLPGFRTSSLPSSPPARSLSRAAATRTTRRPRRSTRRSATCPRTPASPSSPRPTSTTTTTSATSLDKFPFAGQAEDLLKQSLEQGGIDFEEQIEPLLGNEVVIGVDDNASFVDSSADTPFVLAIETEDARQARGPREGRRHARGRAARATTSTRARRTTPGSRSRTRCSSSRQRGHAEERAEAARRGRPPDRGRRRCGVRGPARGRAGARRT